VSLFTSGGLGLKNLVLFTLLLFTAHTPTTIKHNYMYIAPGVTRP